MSECTVCLTTFTDDTDDTNYQRKTLDCGHSFHTQCVDEWLMISETCPVCRDNVAASESEEEWLQRYTRAEDSSMVPTISADDVLEILGIWTGDDFNYLHPLHSVNRAVNDIFGAAERQQYKFDRLKNHLARLEHGWLDVYIEAGLIDPNPRMEYRNDWRVGWEWESVRTDNPYPHQMGLIPSWSRINGRWIKV